MSLSYGDVAEIVKIIDASSCDEVILELEGVRLVVRRGGNTASSSDNTPTAPKSSAPSSSDTPTARPAERKPAATPVATTSEGAEGEGATICAPMVGTFYRRPSPDEPAFVDEGSEVSVGDPLCLIEVMKLYTTIESTEAGTITAILAEEGNLVEFDQPLFRVAPRQG
jgi:acetyl-CoA carboxylase biotin carboxyl carrier protein